MNFRVLAVICGLGAAALFAFAWGNAGPTVIGTITGGAIAGGAITGGAPNAPALPAIRPAWLIAGCATAFALTALLAASILGAVETNLTRRRVAAAPGDETGRPTSARWAAIFASTAISGFAAPRGAGDQAALETSWLERLTLARVISPLPMLVLAADGAAALFNDMAGAGWNAALAVGVCGWLAITLARCLAAAALSPLVARTVAAAVSAIASDGDAAAAYRAPPGAAGLSAHDAGGIARDVAEMLMEPLDRLADAADRLSSAAPHERPVEDALAEIRAGIERLLAASRNG